MSMYNYHSHPTSKSDEGGLLLRNSVLNTSQNSLMRYIDHENAANLGAFLTLTVEWTRLDFFKLASLAATSQSIRQHPIDFVIKALGICIDSVIVFVRKFSSSF